MILVNPALIAVWLILWPIVIIFIGYAALTYIATTLLVATFALFLPEIWLMPWISMSRLEIALILYGIAFLMMTRQVDNIKKFRTGELEKIKLLRALKKESKISEEMLK
ncbi:MAG: hypothetical protein ACTSVB_02350, partial [Candidatus Heimdallarchaeaceae archaeon]